MEEKAFTSSLNIIPEACCKRGGMVGVTPSPIIAPSHHHPFLQQIDGFFI